MEKEKTIYSQLINSKHGLSGLRNMGNTCFLNTAIQCLSNCWELTNYFLRNEYKKDINKKNPIGSHGKLSEAYSKLIHKLWFGKEDSYVPTKFKKELEEINEMYSDNNQQDTQEFLTFLIDGLHEDLNKVINKPYINNNNDDDFKKEDKSLEELYNFKRRNQSLLVELFYGQFNSLIKCPNQDCLYDNTKFEPFVNISLPVTNKSVSFNILCYFIFYDISITPIQIFLEFRNDCTIMALRNKIAKIFNIHPFSFMVEKMDVNGNLEFFLNYKQLLSYKKKNNKEKDNSTPYFLIQHCPNDFYNCKNNIFFNNKNIKEYKTDHYEDCKEEIENREEEIENLFDEDYKENEENFFKENKEKNKTYYQNKNTGKIDNEMNHGMNKDFILVLVYIKAYKNYDVTNTINIIFPRNIFLNKKLTCKEIHYKIFEYFKTICPQETFNKNFNNLDTNNENDNYDFQIKNQYPYRLRIKNIMKNKDKPCVICNKIDCHNCLLPFSDKITLQNLIDKYPLNNKGLKIDNSYYYLTKNQKELNENWNKDFSLVITFPLSRKSSIFAQLNNFNKLNFTIHKSNLTQSIPLSKCFNYFMNWEELDSTNEYYCTKCKTNQKAKKKIQINICPHILIIHLKRFNNKQKLEIKVDFPIRGLDMSKYVLENKDNYDMTYDLFAVAYHIGKVGYGHYYAICYNIITKKWYKFEDSIVSEVKLNEIVNKDAYVLLYRRRNLENIIDLEDLYKCEFISYEKKLEDLTTNESKSYIND